MLGVPVNYVVQIEVPIGLVWSHGRRHGSAPPRKAESGAGVGGGQDQRCQNSFYLDTNSDTFVVHRAHALCGGVQGKVHVFIVYNRDSPIPSTSKARPSMSVRFIVGLQG
jgi:hypothetical protein